MPGVHLKAIKLRGFKSFVDAVEIRLEPGVAVVVGPNGSGKSNVSDSILWATGSMAPGELRAEKPDDVLFSGSSGRGEADFCEVELLFDNQDGAWPDLPYSEVAVTRRMTRGGEGQYLVNKTPVRRIDLIELLSDVGLGGGLRSVISQGRVETVLNSKPAERRELIEEAAGLGRFKRRRHRAELKLARVGIQVERARDLEDEVKKRLRPLALQATAAERARLQVEAEERWARVAAIERGVQSELAQELDEVLSRRSESESQLTGGSRDALLALRGAAQRLGVRHESAQRLLAELNLELVEARQAPAGPSPAERGRAADEADAAARAAVREREDLEARVRLARERLTALEQSLAEREGIPPAARALAEEGEQLALQLLEVEPGAERSTAAALGHRASAILAANPQRGLALVERAKAAGLGSVLVLVGCDPR